MTEIVFECLRAAVNLARYEQIKRVAVIQHRLMLMGFDRDVIEKAFNAWARSAPGGEQS